MGFLSLYDSLKAYIKVSNMERDKADQATWHDN